jgi:hypothetical protein
MEFGEEGHVGGAAVQRSEDGGAENYFKAALDALDPVFNYIGGDSFEYAVGFVRKHLLKSRAVCIGRVSRIGDCIQQEEKDLRPKWREAAKGCVRVGTEGRSGTRRGGTA